MGTNHTKILDIYIWKLAILWLGVDTLNGAFITLGLGIPISQIFKLFFLSLIIFQLIKYKRYLILLFIFIIYIILYLLHLLIGGIDFNLAIISLSRFIILVFSYYYFCYSATYFSKIYLKYSRRVFIIGWIIISLNILLGLLGFGVPSYGEEYSNLGVKGYFYAGNELGSLFASLLPFVIFWINKKYKSYLKIILYISILFTGILIGTKTTILVTILSLCIIPYIYSTKKKKKILIIKTLFIICLTIPIISYLFTNSIGTFSRWSYAYENGGIQRLIFSDRDKYWDIKQEQFFNNTLDNQLFGVGFDSFIERDHLDTIISYGFIGLIFIGGFFIYLICNAIKLKNRNPIIKTVIFSDVLTLLISCFAGHVWYSGMACIYIALINSFTKINKNNIK